MRSRGTTAAARRSSSAVLNVTMPENDTWAPRATAASASAGPPVKQWKTVRGGTPSRSRMSNVSSHASRVWITRASPCRWANAIWRAKLSAWSARGEWS